MIKQHWTPTYILDRAKLFYYQRNNAHSPWLVASSTSFLSTYLKPSDIGLEFGSGRSTIWFAERAGHIVSIEHDPAWHNIISEKIASKKLESKISYYLFEDGKLNAADCNYVNIIDSFDDESFDFILIDGMARDHCTIRSLDKLKKGGIIIIDNVNWYIPRKNESRAPGSRNIADGFESEIWSAFHNTVFGWRYLWETDGISDTAIWFKE